MALTRSALIHQQKGKILRELRKQSENPEVWGQQNQPSGDEFDKPKGWLKRNGSKLILGLIVAKTTGLI